MSGGYASRLSEYADKGVCNLPEITESRRSLTNKLAKFADLVKSSEYITVLTGAGISTSAGIPDFRGPKGIWTLEEKAKQNKKKRKGRRYDDRERRKLKKANTEIEMKNDDASFLASKSHDSGERNDSEEPPPIESFQNAKPTFTHEAITKLALCGKVNYVITQNVDGLHRRSGLPRSMQSILHGCVFTEKCELCGEEYFRDFDVQGVSFQKTGRKCIIEHCGGDLRDTILDWEDELPDPDYSFAQEHCQRSDLVICLGTSLRIEPAGSLPLAGKKIHHCELTKNTL